MIAITGTGSVLGDRIATLLRRRGGDVKPLEIGTVDELKKALRGCKYLYHCHEHFSLSNQSQVFFDENVTATETLLEAAAAAGVRRVLVVSSIAAAGPTYRQRLRTENDPAEPLPAPYQETKRMAEKAALRIAEETGMEVVIARPAFLIGKGVRHAALLFAAYANSTLRAIPCGRNHTYNFIGVDDAAKGCLLAMEKGKPGEVYYLADDENIDLSATLTLFSQLSGLPPFRNIKIPLPFMLILIQLRNLIPVVERSEVITAEFVESYLIWYWIFSNEKAKKELGFFPSPNAQAWRETISWAVEEGYLRQPAASMVKNTLATT